MLTSVVPQGPLPSYPHSVPQSGPEAGRYEYREADFWTCGFFPGSIYALLERAIKFPACITAPEWYHHQDIIADLLRCGRCWNAALHRMSGRTDTHDMGFIVQPALQKDWELTGNLESCQSLIRAAYALISRYDEAVGAIRSWDEAINHRYSIVDMSDNFLVIIDSMCNLDLLYFVGHLVQDMSLIRMATSHANTVRKTLLRPDFSSFHMVNLDPQQHPGAVKAQLTNQGHHDESTWARGQAWAIMGFAQTFMWTQDRVFLETAVACARLFWSRLESARHHHRFVPVWDFDAPHVDPAEPLRDTSAGVIAANGMLIIHQALNSLSRRDRDLFPFSTAVEHVDDFLDAALLIVEQTLDLSLDSNLLSLVPIHQTVLQNHNSRNLAAQAVEVPTNTHSFEAILRNATANNNEHAHLRYWDHGLVYADYYLLEFGNKLCRMGLC